MEILKWIKENEDGYEFYKKSPQYDPEFVPAYHVSTACMLLTVCIIIKYFIRRFQNLGPMYFRNQAGARSIHLRRNEIVFWRENVWKKLFLYIRIKANFKIISEKLE